MTSMDTLGGDLRWQKELASRIKGTIRKEELFARYGGEEFAVVLPETFQEGTITAAERILTVVSQTAFRFEDKTFQVTVSAGVATTQGEAEITPLALIRRADEKLYQAKNLGRNRVCH